jgi:CheY-like chemotaxis protein
MKTKSILKKVRSRLNTDTFYTMSDWELKSIDGIEFVPVVKQIPEKNKKQPVFYMRKDNLETVNDIK